jgi:hypothetical protein
LLWALLNIKYGYGHMVSFQYVLYFTAAMALLAFFLCQNVFVEVLAGVIELILDPPDERTSAWSVGIILLILCGLGIWLFWH